MTLFSFITPLGAGAILLAIMVVSLVFFLSKHEKWSKKTRVWVGGTITCSILVCLLVMLFYGGLGASLLACFVGIPFVLWFFKKN